MKVLQINSVCGIGSTGRIAVDIYHRLKEEGHDCLIAYGRGIVPQGVQAKRIGNNLDIYIHVFMTRVTDKTGFYSKHATKKLIQIIREYKPDQIYLHNLHGYYINIKQLFEYIKKENIPVVWLLHDCWAFTGHCAYFDYCGCNRWKTDCHDCPQKHEYPTSKFRDSSHWNYVQKRRLFTGVPNMQIITPSKWLAGLVEKSFLNEYPVTVKHNRINTEIFKPTQSNFRKKYGLENAYLVLGVANIWDKRKGLHDFVKLAQMLDDSYKIILVGVDQKQKEALPSPILAIERTDNANQLAEIYTAADVFLNLTYEDNYPTTNLEAHACGTEVITYETGGSVESADKIVEKGNIERVSQILKENKERAL